MNESAQTTAHTETAADGGNVLSTLGLNGQLFVIQLFNFAVVIAILWFLILRPLLRVLDERKKLVDKSIEEAKKIEKDYLVSNEKVQAKLDQAAVEANQLLVKAQDEAKVLAEQMKQKAKEDVQTIVQKGRETLEAEKDKMLAAAKAEIIDLVVDSTQKVLGGAMSKEVDKSWLKEQLSKVKK